MERNNGRYNKRISFREKCYSSGFFFTVPCRILSRNSRRNFSGDFFIKSDIYPRILSDFFFLLGFLQRFLQVFSIIILQGYLNKFLQEFFLGTSLKNIQEVLMGVASVIAAWFFNAYSDLFSGLQAILLIFFLAVLRKYLLRFSQKFNSLLPEISAVIPRKILAVFFFFFFGKVSSRNSLRHYFRICFWDFCLLSRSVIVHEILLRFFWNIHRDSFEKSSRNLFLVIFQEFLHCLCLSFLQEFLLNDF